MAKRPRELGDDWIDFGTVERTFQVSKNSLYRWKKDGAIVHQTVGGCCYVTRVSLREKIGHEHYDLRIKALENSTNVKSGV
jgi:hypothetical protein